MSPISFVDGDKNHQRQAIGLTHRLVLYKETDCLVSLIDRTASLSSFVDHFAWTTEIKRFAINLIKFKAFSRVSRFK